MERLAVAAEEVKNGAAGDSYEENGDEGDEEVVGQTGNHV